MARDLYVERPEASAGEAGGVATGPPSDGRGWGLRTLGFRIAVLGAVAQAAGLGIDVWMHVNDPTLAAREALLTFDNLGHVLLIGGIALVLIGIAVAVAGPALSRMSAPIRFGVPIGLALAVGAGSILAANSSLSRGHEHGAASGTQAAGHTHAGGHGKGAELPPEKLHPATRTELAGELRAARGVADRYPTVKEAEAAGYRAVTPYIPLIGAHYMKFLSVDGTFDLDQPEMLLYDGTKKTSRIVGLSYYVVADEEPVGFAGPNDHWHRHIGLCIDTDNPFVLGDEQTTEEECRRRGGVKAEGADGWMVHAWIVPGWESTQGVFSAENAQLQ
jgi:hypothetical protein